MARKNIKGKGRTLGIARPDLAREWHSSKNGSTLTPFTVTCGTHLKVWWQHFDITANLTHEWTSTIANRFYGNGCAICSGHQIQVGVNDLATIRPDVARNWHAIKNGNLLPTMVTVGKSKKVWWQHYHRKTGKWHEWRASIAHTTRTIGNSCAICDGKQVQVGINDLATMRPNIARQWHSSKNGKITTQTITVSSGKDFWWEHYDRKTNKWHEWHDTVDHRKQGRGCAVCHGKQVQAGVNDLATIRPDIAREWHLRKNGKMTAQMVTANSNQEVWWRHYHKSAKTWHEWKGIVNHRVSQDVNCLHCRTKGYGTNSSAFFYVIGANLKGINSRKSQIIQFGISKNIDGRLAAHRKSGFASDPILVKSFRRAVDALSLETALKRLVREHEIPTATQRGIKFDGSTEAFCMEDAMDNEDFLEEFQALVG
jgi:hypothetical protein